MLSSRVVWVVAVAALFVLTAFAIAPAGASASSPASAGHTAPARHGPTPAFYTTSLVCHGDFPNAIIAMQFADTGLNATGRFQYEMNVEADMFGPGSALLANFSNLEFIYAQNETPVSAWVQEVDHYHGIGLVPFLRVWLNLASIPSDVNVTVEALACPYSDFMLSSSGPTGASPTLTSFITQNVNATWGLFDNGAQVFPFYDNFSVPALDTNLWSLTAHSWTYQNNGTALNGSVYAVNGSLQYSSSFQLVSRTTLPATNGTFAVDAFAQVGAVPFLSNQFEPNIIGLASATSTSTPTYYGVGYLTGLGIDNYGADCYTVGSTNGQLYGQTTFQHAGHLSPNSTGAYVYSVVPHTKNGSLMASWSAVGLTYPNFFNLNSPYNVTIWSANSTHTTALCGLSYGTPMRVTVSDLPQPANQPHSVGGSAVYWIREREISSATWNGSSTCIVCPGQNGSLDYPPQPQNLTLSAGPYDIDAWWTNAQVKNWTATTSRLYWGTTCDHLTTAGRNATLTGGASRFVITLLAPNTGYCVGVVAVNGTGASALSYTTITTAATGPPKTCGGGTPDAVTRLTIVAPSGTSNAYFPFHAVAFEAYGLDPYFDNLEFAYTSNNTLVDAWLEQNFSMVGLPSADASFVAPIWLNIHNPGALNGTFGVNMFVCGPSMLLLNGTGPFGEAPQALPRYDYEYGLFDDGGIVFEHYADFSSINDYQGFNIHSTFETVTTNNGLLFRYSGGYTGSMLQQVSNYNWTFSASNFTYVVGGTSMQMLWNLKYAQLGVGLSQNANASAVGPFYFETWTETPSSNVTLVCDSGATGCVNSMNTNTTNRLYASSLVGAVVTMAVRTTINGANWCHDVVVNEVVYAVECQHGPLAGTKWYGGFLTDNSNSTYYYALSYRTSETVSSVGTTEVRLAAPSHPVALRTTNTSVWLGWTNPTPATSTSTQTNVSVAWNVGCANTSLARYGNNTHSAATTSFVAGHALPPPLSDGVRADLHYPYTLTRGQTVCFAVFAWNVLGASVPMWYNLTAYETRPGPVVDLHAVAGATTLKIVWSPSWGGGIFRSVLWWNRTCSGGTAAMTEAFLNASPLDTYTLSGLLYQTRYCVAVSDVNQSGMSPLSWGNFSTSNAAHPPNPVTGLSVTARYDVQIDIAWTNPLGPITAIFVTYSHGGGRVFLDSLPGTNVTAHIVGLSASTAYNISVQAWNLSGGSARASTAATTLAAPPGPTNLVARGSATGVNLTWTNPTAHSVTNDTVFLGTTCGVWTTVINTRGAVERWAISGLVAGQTYCFTVTAWYTSANETAEAQTTQATVGTTNVFGINLSMTDIYIIAGVLVALLVAALWFSRTKRHGMNDLGRPMHARRNWFRRVRRAPGRRANPP